MTDIQLIKKLRHMCIWFLDEYVDYNGTKEAFDTAIQALYERINYKHEWIPVTKMLPEYGTQVLTTQKDGDYELNYVMDEEDGEWFFNGVIVWMSLPKPYREDES